MHKIYMKHYLRFKQLETWRRCENSRLHLMNITWLESLRMKLGHRKGSINYTII